VRRQRALQLPANLAILTEQENLHDITDKLKTRAVCHFPGHLLCETRPIIYPYFFQTHPRTAMSITIKTPDEIEKMRVAGRLAGEVLDYIEPYVKAGITTDELDKLCHDLMVDVQGCIPAPLNYAPSGYDPYPKSICTSVNQQVCHGVPGERVLKNGDIINLDITTIKDGYHGDTSRMFIVGEGSIQAKRLCEITFECMWLGISVVKPGAHLGDIGAIIQKYAEKNGFSVVREFCGHGIGKKFHEDPQVLHYGKAGTGPKLEPGMIFTIEPMINAGKAAIREMADGWTIVTKDRSLSAQWEHTVLVTETGYEVLTLPPAAARSLTGSSDELRRCRPARRGKGQPASTPANYECSNDARALLRERCAGRCGTRKLWHAFDFPPRWRWRRSAATVAASCSRRPISTC
jgi:methionyl aminopeptidase